MRGVRVVLLQRDQRVSVALADAAPDGSLTVTFGVPPTLTTGSALVATESSSAAPGATPLATATVTLT